MICICGAMLFLALMFLSSEKAHAFSAGQLSAFFHFQTFWMVYSLLQKHSVRCKCELCIFKLSYIEKNLKKEINYDMLDIGQYRIRLVILYTG